MLAVDDREMVVDDRKWIAIDCVIRVERNSPFFGIEIFRTKETRPLRNGIAIDSGSGTRHAMRNMSHENIEPVDAHATRVCIGKPFYSTCKARPGLALIFK